MRARSWRHRVVSSRIDRGCPDPSPQLVAVRPRPDGGDLPVRRAVIPLAIVLALATGAVLQATGDLVRHPTLAMDSAGIAAANAAAVRRFYEAVNGLIATGDSASLDGILAADFVDHAPRPGTAPDRSGFLRGLHSLRETAPALRLTVLDLVADRDRVATRVGVEGAEEATFLGLAVAPGQLWGAGDVYRVEA